MMTTHTHTGPLTARSSAGNFSFLALARRIAATRRQRQILRALDNSALHDIGLTRTQAQAEASRPLWDVPTNWLR